MVRVLLSISHPLPAWMHFHPAHCTRRASLLSKVSSACPVLSHSLTFAGLSESLAREVTPLGIRVLLVEPGAFRTQFATAVVQPKNPMGDIYPAVKGVLDKFAVIHGTEIGDPSKGAARIVEAIDGVGMGGDLKGKVLRIPLGSDCITRWEKKIESEKADLATGRAVGYSTDFN